MEQLSKQNALMRLFACYPSLIVASEEQITLMMGAYLEKLSTVSDESVDAACRVLSSKPEQFPPSAGIVFDKAREIQFKRSKADEESAPRIPYVAPFDRLSPEEREEQRRKVESLVAEFKLQKVLQ